jgi:hypothetical protein
VATRAVRASPGKTAPSFADCVSRQAACRRPDSSASSYSSLCSVPLSAPASDRPALPSCLSIKFGAIRLMNHEHIARARPDLEAVIYAVERVLDECPHFHGVGIDIAHSHIVLEQRGFRKRWRELKLSDVGVLWLKSKRLCERVNRCLCGTA